MSDTKTNIRVADATIKLTGKVSEKALTVTTTNGKTSISGYVVVKTSPENFVRVNVMQNALTKDGKENKAYKGLETVMNEYKAIADVGEEAADVVHVNGKLNPYTSRQSGQSSMGYKASFFNRAKKEVEPSEYKAEFDSEVYITAILPKLDKDGIETDEVVVKGWLPIYNGTVEPIELTAPSDIADAVRDTYHVGDTVNFFGDIINNRIEKKTEIPATIGKPRIEISYENKNDLIITGAGEAYATSDDPKLVSKAYTKEEIALAVQERDNNLAAQPDRSVNTTASSASANRHIDY